VRFDPSFVSQMFVGLVLVELVGFSIVCLSCYCRQSVVFKVQVAVANGSVVFVLRDCAIITWRGGWEMGKIRLKINSRPPLTKQKVT